MGINYTHIHLFHPPGSFHLTEASLKPGEHSDASDTGDNAQYMAEICR